MPKPGDTMFMPLSGDLTNRDASTDPTPVLQFLLPDEDVVVNHEFGPNTTTSANATVDYSDIRDENLAKIEIAVQAIIFMLAVFGNGCVLVALRYRKRKTSRMHLFIMHLSIADLLVAFLNILPQLAWDITFRFQGTDGLCRLIKYLQVMVMYLSAYILVMTAIDRYRAICHPMSSYSWTTKRANIMVAIAWILSAGLSIPQAVIFKMQEVHPGSEVVDCWANFKPEWTLRVYITTFSITVYLIPSVILAALYGKICVVVWKNVRRRRSDSTESDSEEPSTSSSYLNNSWRRNTHQNGGSVRYRFTGTGQIAVEPNRVPRAHHGLRGTIWGKKLAANAISRSKMKTIKLTFVVIIAYLLCWAPFFVTQLWWAYDEDAPYNSATFVICLLLASLNSCCNPWIYMAFSGNLIQQILPCCKKKKKPVQNVHYHREKVRFAAQPQRKFDYDDDDEDKIFHEDIPLQIQGDKDKLRRKSTLLSRTSSTKMTNTLYRTDSRNSRQYPLRRYSRENGYGGQNGQWPPWVIPRMMTKVCECKQCLKATDEKKAKTVTKPAKNDDGASSSSKNSSSSSRKKSWVEGKKKEKAHSDNSFPFLSYKSFGEDQDGDHNVKFTSV